MKTIKKLTLALLFLGSVIITTSCTDEIEENINENEADQIFRIDKGDISDPDGDDDEIDTSED